MKAIFQILFLLTLWTSLYGQETTDRPYAMTNAQNTDWLKDVKHADKKSQLELVKARLFEKRQTLNPAEKLEVPVLIIDGIPVGDNIDTRQRNFLNSQLTTETVNIQVIENEPEGLYINKAFAGIVLITITDKKASKRFKKLR